MPVGGQVSGQPQTDIRRHGTAGEGPRCWRPLQLAAGGGAAGAAQGWT